MQALTLHTTPHIVFEPGGIGRLGALASARLGPRVLLVTDPGIRNAGIVDAAIVALADAGCAVEMFAEVEADPSYKTVMAATERALRGDATGIVGFGGGSSMDVAKLVAALAGGDQTLDDMFGLEKVRRRMLPLVLVPTTAGTGSEVTKSAIVTLEGDRKLGVISSALLPDMALLDPDLTLGLPAPVTAATGIDAMTHAIESYTARHPNNNPISRAMAIEALKLLGRNIETAVHEPDNREARGAMLFGAMTAGIAFANSPVAAVHALAHPIGGGFHVPHGLANALVLPHVMRFNAGTAAGRYAELAPHIFPDLAPGGDDAALCSTLIDRIAELRARIGLVTQLRDIGVAESDLPGMAEKSRAMEHLFDNNPRDMSVADVLGVYRAAY
ncbi:MAG: iron-containing alcohol dehydrogenase [Alphaproteobacteria bacterium]|jgi:alcohol dehydrogenase class IV